MYDQIYLECMFNDVITRYRQKIALFLCLYRVVPITKTIWPGKVNTHDIGVRNVTVPTTSVPRTSICFTLISRSCDGSWGSVRWCMVPRLEPRRLVTSFGRGQTRRDSLDFTFTTGLADVDLPLWHASQDLSPACTDLRWLVLLCNHYWEGVPGRLSAG